MKKDNKEIKILTRKEILQEVSNRTGASYSDLSTLYTEIDHVIQSALFDVEDESIARVRLFNWLYIDATISRNKDFNLPLENHAKAKRKWDRRLTIKAKISRFFRDKMNTYWRMARE